MKQSVCIFGLICVILMPSFGFAEDTGIIGSNMGLDFYSRIDDAGDSLAQGITKRRLTEKGNYKSLGCNASWLDNEKIDQNLLEELRTGNYSSLLVIATAKQVTTNTPELSLLSQCLVEKYNEIQKSSHQDQGTLEAVGNIGLYTDGDIQNSDYDILYDITRINGIVFKQKDEYTGAKNASSKAIANMLAGKPIAALFPSIGGTSQGSNSNNTSGSNVSNSANLIVGSNTNPVPAGGKTVILPWSAICSTGSATVGTNGLFGDGFFDGLDTTLAGGSTIGNGVTYTPGGSQGGNSISAAHAANFGTSQKSDFFNKLPCSGIFCITINMKKGNMNILGSSKNSIEGLLESHTKMMEPISWSDLSQQKMTNNFYQLPFLNIKFRNKIAGARVFITDAPQIKKTIEKEATPAMADAKFDLDLKCAMNEAGLPGDMKLVNGFIGAGYGPARGKTIENITNTIVPLGPQEMETLEGCYDIRIGQGKKEADKGLATDLNEIQAFTNAMDAIIQQILQLDKKLDKLPSK